MEYPIEVKGKTIKQVKKLNLSGKNLKVIPQNVYQYTNLEKLDLSNNRIETIPSDILKLRKLRTLDLAFNQIKSLQSAIFKLPKLRILNLHGNSISKLPKQIMTSNLQTLIISKNNITHIDDQLRAKLKKLDVVDNPLSEKSITDVSKMKPLEEKKTELKEPVMEIERKNKIFISYSHADIEYYKKLTTHLKVLQNYFDLEVWSDKEIHAGEHWKQEIAKALNEANIAILLVSTEFLASDFIQNHELPPILKKAEKENTKILSLLVKPSIFTTSELGEFQAINDPNKTLSEKSDPERDRAYIKLVGEIMRIVKES